MTPKERLRERLFQLPPPWRIAVLCLALGLALLAGWSLIAAGRNLLGRWRYDARVARAEAARAEADEHAEAARRREAEAVAARAAIEARLAEAETRAAVAEAALDGARSVTVRVKGEYDEARNRDLSAVSADVVGLCTKLAELGYSCRRAGPSVR